MRSFVKVQRADGQLFDYGFHLGDKAAQRVLRQTAIDVVMIQLQGAERDAVIDQFINLPFNEKDAGTLTYYGDHAKFVARHLLLLDKRPSDRENDDDIDDNTGLINWLRQPTPTRS